MDTKKIIKELAVAERANMATYKTLNGASKSAVTDNRFDFEELTQDRMLNRNLSRVGVNLNTFIYQVAMANVTTASALTKIIELLEKKEKKNNLILKASYFII